MTAPEMMTVHPTDETLAAFIDDRLKANQRREAIEHLADCDECRTFVNDLSDIKAMDEENNVVIDEADNVVEMPKRGWRVAAASFAVAAGLLVVFAQPIREWTYGRSMADLAESSAMLDTRPTDGRLSAAFPYKKPVTRYRSGNSETNEDPNRWIVLSDVDKLEAARWRNPHKLGVAHLLAGDTAQAIDYLSEAAESNETAKLDLAAALLARGREGDYAKALELSKQSDTPVALWNRAAALKLLNQDDAAIEAWKAYLKVDRDPKSEWAKEAQRNIDDLEYNKGFAAPATK